jgi:hypothetical protein
MLNSCYNYGKKLFIGIIIAEINSKKKGDGSQWKCC